MRVLFSIASTVAVTVCDSPGRVLICAAAIDGAKTAAARTVVASSCLIFPLFNRTRATDPVVDDDAKFPDVQSQGSRRSRSSKTGVNWGFGRPFGTRAPAGLRYSVRRGIYLRFSTVAFAASRRAAWSLRRR